MLFALKVMQKVRCTKPKSLETLQSVEMNTEYDYTFNRGLDNDDYLQNYELEMFFMILTFAT